MPNYVEQYVTVCGDADAVLRFVEAARGRMPRTGDKSGGNFVKEEKPVVEFCFHALVPLPARYSQIPYGDGGEQGIDLEVQTWGIKWGAFRFLPTLHDPGCVTYRFTTAWGCPVEPFYEMVAIKWPDLDFLVSYGGEGPVRGYATFRCGGCIKQKDVPYRKEDYPEATTETEDSEEYSNACKRVEKSYLIGHAALVGRWLALHRERLAFAPDDPVLRDWLTERGYETHGRWLGADHDAKEV